MNIPLTDIHVSGPAILISTKVNNQLHWCLLNLLVISHFKLSVQPRKSTWYTHAHNYRKAHVAELGVCTNMTISRSCEQHKHYPSFCSQDTINITATCSAQFYTVGYKEKCLVGPRCMVGIENCIKACFLSKHTHSRQLVSVPDPKPTPVWITFSIPCYTGSDVCTR